MATAGCLLLFATAGCKKNQESGQGFDLRYEEHFTIPAGIGPFVTHHFYLKNISTQYAALLAQHGLTEADVTKVLTTQGNLAAEFDEYNFDFVDKIAVRLYDERNPDVLTEVAYRDPVPLSPGPDLGLIPSLADAKSMLQNDRISMDVRMDLRQTTQDEIPVVLILQFRASY